MQQNQKYSIGDLEKLTGDKAHTIRVWEKRYHIISPERTDTNIRYYSVRDLQRLLNIAFLNRHGWKISRIAGLPDEQMLNVITSISQQADAPEAYLSDLLGAVTDLNEERFETLLNSAILKLGFEESFNRVVFPLLDKVALLWQISKINACQERFVSNLVRHKLVVACDGLSGHSSASKGHYLLYLPANHYDETLLLYANYILRKHGKQVLYLGPSIPLEHLGKLDSRESISHVVIALNQPFTEKENETYFSQLGRLFPSGKTSVILFSPGPSQPDIPGMQWIQSADSLCLDLL